VATIRIILSLSQEEEKSENPVHMKTKNLSLVLIPVLAYFSALPSSQAVNPPPYGGYPGFNTAEGQNALLNLTTGDLFASLAGRQFVLASRQIFSTLPASLNGSESGGGLCPAGFFASSGPVIAVST